jgi:hypothetical protein
VNGMIAILIPFPFRIELLMIFFWQDLVMHVGNMEKDGHPFKADFCCYKVITRVQEDERNYTRNSDKLIE